MRKVIYLFLTLCVAGALVIADTGCTAKAKRAHLLQRADRDFDSGQYDKAELEYLTVLRGDWENVQAIRRLGTIYFDQGRYSRAAPFLNKGTQVATNDLELRMKWGLICLALGKTKDARDQASFILDKNPSDEEAPLLLAKSAVTKKELDDTRQHLQKLAQTGDRPSFEVGLGILSFREADFKTAEADYKRALALDPKSAAAYEQLGALYAFENNLPQAEAALKTAYELSAPRSARRLQYAQFKIKTGDLPAGKNLLEEMTKTVPDYLPAWMELANVAAAQTNYDDCATYLSTVLARDPNNYDAMTLDCELKLARGQTADAITALERMTAIYTGSPPIFYKLALAYLANNDTKKGIDNLTQAINLNTNYTEAILMLSQVQIRSGELKMARGQTADAISDFNPAIISLQRLIQQQPQIPQAQLLLADAFRGQSNFDSAVTIYQGLEKTFPTNSRIPLLLGSTFRQEQNNADARKAFNRVLELDQDNLFAFEQLENLDLIDKQYATAIQRAEQRVDKNPKPVEPRLYLANAFIAQGDDKQAEATLLKTIELHPESQEAYLMLAKLHFNNKQTEKALAELQFVTTKNPSNTSALMLTGVIQDSEKNYKAAADAYEKLLAVNPAVDPRSSLPLNNLASDYSELGQLDRASELAQQARKFSNDPYTADTLGWVLFKQGQYASALSLLQESAGKLPAQPEIQFHLGMVNYMMGGEEPARVAFQSALQSNQDFPGRDECALCLSLLAIDPKTADADARAKLEKRISDRSDDQVALTRLAAIYQRDGTADKAITAYEAALKINSRNATTLVNLAQLYSSKDVQKAFGFARDAYKISPNDAQVASTLGRLAYATGNYKLAFNLLKQTSQDQPGNAALLYNYAKAAYSMGSVPEAAAAMQNALQIGLPATQSAEATRLLEMIGLAASPDQAVAAVSRTEDILKSEANYVPALVVMAVINERKNDIAAAQQTYEKVLTQYPDFAPAQKKLAILYAEDPDKKEKAYALALKARATFPDDSELAKAFAIIVFQQGEYTRAVSLLKASAADRSTDPEPLYYLGLAQYHLKDRGGSKAALQGALRLNLSDKQAAEAKRILAESK